MWENFRKDFFLISSISCGSIGPLPSFERIVSVFHISWGKMKFVKIISYKIILKNIQEIPKKNPHFKCAQFSLLHSSHFHYFGPAGKNHPQIWSSCFQWKKTPASHPSWPAFSQCAFAENAMERRRVVNWTYAHISRILFDCEWPTENAINVVFGFHCVADKQFAVVVIFYDFTFDPVVHGKMIFKLQFHVVLMGARARSHLRNATTAPMRKRWWQKRAKCAMKMVL